MNYNRSDEVWKDVIGFEGVYQVSNTGKVKRLAGTTTRAGIKYTTKKDRILKGETTEKGYVRIALNSKPKHRRVFIHVLVAEAFLGKPNQPYMQVNHKNGIKDDNRLENLEWVTGSENVKHAFELGLSSKKRGENNRAAVLTEKDVILILRLNSYGKLTHKELSEVFEVSKSTITAVTSGRNWSYLASK